MAKVAIVMGSDSDMPIMKKAAEFLDQMGIDFEMTIISAHREPDIFFEWAKGAKDRGVKVIIAGAGKAAHLPGMCAALFPMPVIGTKISCHAMILVKQIYQFPFRSHYFRIPFYKERKGRIFLIKIFGYIIP